MASADRTVLTESDITTPGPLKTALDSAGGDAPVSSVNGSTGDVVLSAPDVGAAPLYPDSTGVAAMPVESGSYLGHVDEQTVPGVYRVSSASMTEANGYPPTPDNTGTLVVQSSFSRAYLIQTVYSNKNEVVWTRSRVANSWHPWQQIVGGDAPVQSVNGSTGDVVLSAEDLGAVSRADFVDQVSGAIYDGDTPIDFGPGHDFSVAVIAGEAYGLAANNLNHVSNMQETVHDILVRSGIQTLTNPTTIPVDGPERLDLVFTEPTTVDFADPSVSSSQAPGATDLVLSIEGYEHVTWEGVVVHGMPSATSVVWASALWRQRDSTWHLLCEQDPSQGGGANLRTFTWENFAYSPDTDASGNYVMLSGGRVSHSQKPAILPQITDKFVTLGLGDDEVIANTSYASPDTEYAPYALYPSMLAQSNSVSTAVEGLPDGMFFQVMGFRITSEGVRLAAMLALSTVPSRGRTSEGGFVLSIPKDVLPPVGFYDTGEVTLPIPGLPQNPRIQIDNTSRVSGGLTVGIPSTLNGPLPTPDPDTPGLSEAQKEYAEYGFHLIEIDQVFPYRYFSMLVDQT